MLVEWTRYVHMQSHMPCYDKTTSSGSHDGVGDCSKRVLIQKADHLEDWSAEVLATGCVLAFSTQ